MNELSCLGIALEARRIGARLMIEQHELRALTDALHIAECPCLPADRTTVHPDPQAVCAAGVARRAVEEIPDFQAARIVPLDPLAKHGVVPVPCRGNGVARSLAKTARAVVAIADAFAPHTDRVVCGVPFGRHALHT